jgi:RHS repeat-associated protein
VAGTTLSYTPQWPAAISDIRFAPDAQLGSVPANSWWGSLALDQRDATGLLYRRNRYYDPQTGRFTQSDPIGLAGGLNLYGYANGDPINYSDPFGLCPDSTSTEAQEECEEEAERDVGEEAERACAIESFRLGAGFAADALAVGAIYRGARAAGRLAANYGTNLAFRGRGMWVPQQILAGNRADIAGAVIQTGQAHAIGAAATSPIGIQADDGSVGVGDVAAAVVTAMVPFSGLPAQVARTEAACNPQ